MADSVEINMLTPEEKQTFLALVGAAILAQFAAVITSTLLHGAFVIVFYTSSASILRRGLGSHSRQAMFSLTLISFVTATICWAGGMSAFIIEVQSILSRNLDLPLIERLQLQIHSASASVLIGLWAQALLLIISDIVIIWRAWVLFFENRWVMIGPLVLLLGTITTTLLYLIPVSNFEVLQAISIMPNSTPEIDYLATASLALSLGTNVLATLMIAYKLWRHRAFLTEMLGSNQPRSRAQNVLIILAESGVLYFILQLVTFLLGICSGPWAEFVAAKIFLAIYYELTAMYPMIVVVLVNQQRSFVDTYGFTNVDLNGAQTHGSNAPARRATVGHLSFVRPRTNGSSDDVGETQNLIGETNADGEVDVSETRFLKGTVDVDVDVEKRQAKTAPF